MKKAQPTKAQIEAAAAAIGLVVGTEAGQWSESYLPKVKWPKDYSTMEQWRLRHAALTALLAARS